MPFGSFLERIPDHHRRLIVSALDDTGTDLAEVPATRNLTVDHR